MGYRTAPQAPTQQLLGLRAKLLAEIRELRRIVGEPSRPIRGQGLEGEIQALGIERDRLVARAQLQQALRRGALLDPRREKPPARWRDWLLEAAIQTIFSLWP